MNCPDCHKVFKSRKGLQYHTDHHVCNGGNGGNGGNRVDKTCHKCGKTFTDKRNFVYHLEHVQCKTQSTIADQRLIELCDKVTHLEKLLEEIKDRPQTINANTTKINIIVPPAFLTVDNHPNMIKHLSRVLDTAIVDHTDDCVSFLIRQTNCNPRLPLYNSIKIPNKKDSMVMISDGTKFIYDTKKRVIERLIENKHAVLQNYLDSTEKEYGRLILERYDRYVDSLENEETKRALESEITSMLLNISDVIGSEKWSEKLLTDLKLES